MSEYLESKTLADFPRLPTEGSLDLTYRCNNNCRHCWLRIPPEAGERQKELTLNEIIEIVDEARKMGCRHWSISGGEPMLRSDFAEIFDYITGNSASYTLNTNGTLITHEIALLMKRKGQKMVSLYGATADVHDHITRNPGSFDAALRGIAYLKEAGVGFIVQLVPMRDNMHQYDDMLSLAKSLAPHWRLGASWLYSSAYADLEKKQEIVRQRIDPTDVIRLNSPDPFYENVNEENCKDSLSPLQHDDRFFVGCAGAKRDFHIDPYGRMTFCFLIKDPDLLYDLRKGTFQEAWEEFFPSLTTKIRGGSEYSENCGACELRKYCQWCPAYGYLEHGRYSAKVEYLCAVARENKTFREDWIVNHRRYYKIAGVTIQVDSDLPITDDTFAHKFKLFEVDGPGEDNIVIRHYFSIPNVSDQDLGKEVYRKIPWAVYRKQDAWIYLGIGFYEEEEEELIWRLAIFSDDHTSGRIYNNGETLFHNGDLHSLTMFPSDQILLARIFADRQACYLHSSGIVLDGKGLVFVGHSEAGKSTMVKMFMDKAEILCDDRIIVRKWQDGFKIHGNWSHGEVPDVSANSAPLNAIMFLEQSKENQIIPLTNVREITKRLLPCLAKPLVTADWWEKNLALMEHIIREIPCYIVQFDKSGQIVDLLKDI